MARKQAFSDEAIRNLSTCAISDPITAGLSIEANGARRTWRYYRRLTGTAKPVRLVDGSYPTVSIKGARLCADTLDLAVDAGTDPRETKRAAKAAGMTLGDARALF